MRHVRPRAVALLALLAPTSLGCASSYVPRPGPHVALVQDGGTISYVREGVKYDGGIFGGDIEEAVSGSPRAEEYAREYKTGMTTGFIMTMIGALGAVGGGVWIGDAASQNPVSNSGITSGTVVLLSGIVVELVGAGIAARAQTHLYDAVNVFNDEVDAGRVRAAPPVYGPPQVAPPATALPPPANP
ncbi:MAG TPA: hypothetical protein VF765_31540 [Polyangiaceae bacterium]